MKYLLYLLTSLCAHLSYAQTSRIEVRYFDIHNQETPDTSAALYKQTIEIQSPLNDNKGTLFYYIDDTLMTIAPSNNLEQKMWYGNVTHYRPTGELLTTSMYKNGMKHGRTLQFFLNGQAAVKAYFMNDSMISAAFYTQEGKDTSENLFRRRPVAHPDYKKIINTNLRYPTAAKNAGIAGRIMVAIIIDKDGSILQIEVEKHPGGGLAEEAVRVISLLPNFTPGIIDGLAAKDLLRIPIDFKLE